jgi:DNA-binding transcriptional LysR family regulator
MTIDIVSIHCFLAVCETKSFTKAALKVNRTQSAVSQQIAKLENILNKKLFNKDKSLSLTEDGEIFFNYAKKFFSLHFEMIDHFKKPELAGEVNFGVPEDFVSVFLSDVLTDFTRIHPRISLNVDCDLTVNLFEKFRQKKLDLVLVKSAKKENYPYKKNIWTEKLRWYGDENLVKKNQIIPLVMSPNPCIYRENMINSLEQKKIKWRAVFVSHSYNSKIAAIKAGLGISALPPKVVGENIAAIETKILPTLSNIHISLLKHNNENFALNSFEEFIIKYLG